jgi:hypothetical protein
MVCGFTPKYWVKKFLYPGYGVKPVKNQGDWQKIFKIAAAAGIKKREGRSGSRTSYWLIAR